MSPIPQIDIFRLVSCHVVSHTDAVAHITQTSGSHQNDADVKAAKPHSERRTQIRALITGTLLFVPFFAAYLVVCASH